MYMLQVRSISVNYGESEILHDVSIEVAAGEVVALIGPNGAGKTTLIRAISGVLPLKSGSVHAAGSDLSNVTVSQTPGP
jgi:branched-chain amino acid transport system ATP-binding protein